MALGTDIGLIGGGIASLFSAQGSQAAAQGYITASGDYLKAEKIAQANEHLTAVSTGIQEAQLTRKVEMTQGATTAAIAGGNLEGGFDLMRMNIQQGALAKSLVQVQGNINENAFAEQAQAYQAMSDSAIGAAQAAQAAAKAQTASGITGIFGGIIGAIGSIFSL